MTYSIRLYIYIINTLNYLIILDITQDTVAHCISWLDNGQLKSCTKSAQNLKIMQLAIQLSWSG